MYFCLTRLKAALAEQSGRLIAYCAGNRSSDYILKAEKPGSYRSVHLARRLNLRQN